MAQDLLKIHCDTMVWADGKEDTAEIEQMKKINIFIKQGKSAASEIVSIENSDLLPNYYLSSNSQTKPLTQATKIVTLENKEFINICEIQRNNYYVAHPMNQNILYDIKTIDKIEEKIVDEWNGLANKLGAKRFSCTLEIEQSIEDEHSHNVDVDGRYMISDAKIQQASTAKQTERKKHLVVLTLCLREQNVSTQKVSLLILCCG